MPEKSMVTGEILSTDQLRSYAHSLAEQHKLAKGPCREVMLQRLHQNRSILEHSYKLVSRSITTRECRIPAAIWLLDNFYLIEENIRLAMLHLP